jgi:hypothetical protein
LHDLNFGWLAIRASEHLVGMTSFATAHLIDGAWTQTRTVNVAFTDCVIHFDESADREIVLTVVRPGFTDSYVETIPAGESTSLVDGSDESWAMEVTNQL